MLLVLPSGGYSKDKSSAASDLELSSEDVEAGAASNEEAKSVSAGKQKKGEGEATSAGDPYDNDWNNLNVSKNIPKQAANNASSKGDKTSSKKSSDSNGSLQGNDLQTATNSGLANQTVANQTVPTNNTLSNTAVPNVPPEEPPLDQEPAPQAFEPPPAEPLPTPPPVAEVPVQSPANEGISSVVASVPQRGGWIIKTGNPPDLEPKMATLHWVGYDFSEREGLVRVQMVTRGSPKYNIFQERNRANQPELIVRFFNTALRKKLRRDINASEFRSPVAYVRMRPNTDESYVDVVLTMRDMIQPRLFNKYGNIMLTFHVPDHYFGTSTVGNAPVAKAEIFPNAFILPDIDQGSVEPEGIKVTKAYVPNPSGEIFETAPKNGGEPVIPAAAPENPPEMVPVDGMLPGQEPVAPMPPDQTMVNPVPFTNPAEVGIPGNGGSEEFPANGSENLAPISNEQAASANAQGTDNINFGGNPEASSGQGAQTSEPLPSDGSTGTSNSSNGTQSEDVEDTLDSDSLDNLDNGEGESTSEVDKFDVRVRSPRDGNVNVAQTAISVTGFTLFGVAQDNFNNSGISNPNNATAEKNSQSNQAPQSANKTNQGNTGGISDDDFGPLQENPASPNVGADSAGQANAGSSGLTNNGAIPNAPQGTADGNPSALNATNPSAGGLNAGTNIPQNNLGASPPANILQNNSGVSPPANIPANTALNATIPPTNPALPPSSATEIQPVMAPVAETVPGGEPPIQGQPDLAGTEQVGQESEEPKVQSTGGRPIKLDFRGAPLSEVIRVLSEESGINFVMAPEVGRIPVYINLAGVPFNDALRAVLESNALGMVELSPNVIRIDKLATLTAEKENLARVRKAELKIRPTKILVHRLSYTDAAKAATLLEKMLIKEGQDPKPSISIEPRTNSVIVNAPTGDLATAKALLERVDLETPQVKIASRIVEVLRTAADGLGISWGGPFNLDQGRGLGFGNLVFPNYFLSRYSVDAGGLSDRIGNFQGRIGSLNNSMAFDLALSLEESRGTGEVLQSSNLLVQDNEKARILDGRSDYFPPPNVAAGGGSQAGGGNKGDVINYNLIMEVQPHITADGAIQMDVDIQSDSPTASTAPSARAASINRSIKTKLLRRSGETAVIGGVYSSSKTGKKSGIPFLQSIPIIGALFRTSESSESKKELLVLVTPTIISGMRGSESGEVESGAGAGASSAGLTAGGGETASFGGQATSQNNIGSNAQGSLQGGASNGEQTNRNQENSSNNAQGEKANQSPEQGNQQNQEE